MNNNEKELISCLINAHKQNNVSAFNGYFDESTPEIKKHIIYTIVSNSESHTPQFLKELSITNELKNDPSILMAAILNSTNEKTINFLIESLDINKINNFNELYFKKYDDSDLHYYIYQEGEEITEFNYNDCFWLSSVFSLDHISLKQAETLGQNILTNAVFRDIMINNRTSFPVFEIISECLNYVDNPDTSIFEGLDHLYAFSERDPLYISGLVSLDGFCRVKLKEEYFQWMHEKTDPQFNSLIEYRLIFENALAGHNKEHIKFLISSTCKFYDENDKAGVTFFKLAKNKFYEEAIAPHENYINVSFYEEIFSALIQLFPENKKDVLFNDKQIHEHYMNLVEYFNLTHSQSLFEKLFLENEISNSNPENKNNLVRL